MHTLVTNKPVIFITMGDPAGIGPEITAKALLNPSISCLANFFIIGDETIFKNYMSPELAGKVNMVKSNEINDSIFSEKKTICLMDPGPETAVIIPGVSSKECSQKALNSILQAADSIQNPVMSGMKKAIVTAPVCKEAIAEVTPGFIGHTEFFRDAFSSDFVTMAFVGKTLRVVPVTRHIPIKDVASTLTGEMIEKTILQVVDSKELMSGKATPVIGVSALNPHSGESGKIGSEEIEIIAPAVENVRKKYSNIVGPLPADVVFYKAYNGNIDIVISMYHDQCLGPFKMIDFECGVNLTLGLGYVRTSPDHGTAFDIAGKGVASSESMEAAIKLAAKAII